MKKILLSAVCVLAFASAADARPIGTGQEMWRGNAPWAVTGPQGSDAMRDGNRWERRDDRMHGDHDKAMHDKKCAKGKKGKKCRKMKMDHDAKYHNDDRDMRRSDMMRRDDPRDGDRWHSRDDRGNRHMDLDNDGRRW